MSKIIQLTEFSFLETDDQVKIDRAIAAGLTVVDSPINPDDYLSDGSDRPEFISQATKDAIKAEQDLINDIENKPRIILALNDIPYQDEREAQYKNFPYEQLSDYFSNMVFKQSVILRIIRLKDLEDIIENWNIEGVKPLPTLQTEIQTILDARDSL